MGTGADFYIVVEGETPRLEWLGSVGMDGYPEGIPPSVWGSSTEEDYRREVVDFVKGRRDGTLPEQGWPWSWENSRLTDCVYIFRGGKVWYAGEEMRWCEVMEILRVDDYDKCVLHDYDIPFPDMSALKNVTLGPRSGLIVVLGS